MEINRTPAKDSMDVVFSGMSPNNRLEYFIKSELNRILEMCPHDTYLKTEVQRDDEDHVTVVIRARHTLGQFVSYGQGEHVGEAFVQAMNSISEILDTWRDSRIH